MKCLSLFLLIFIIFSLAHQAQHTNILIDDSGSSMQPEEPSILVDPKNTDHMVGGTNINNMYYSTDGGFTWQHEELTSTYGVWGDPAIIVDTAGAYYFFHLRTHNRVHGSIASFARKRILLAEHGIMVPIWD